MRSQGGGGAYPDDYGRESQADADLVDLCGAPRLMSDWLSYLEYVGQIVGGECRMANHSIAYCDIDVEAKSIIDLRL